MDWTESLMEAASSLLLLAEGRCQSPPRRAPTIAKEQITPPHKSITYQMTGLKRVRDDTISLTYARGNDEFSVSVSKGMTVSGFLHHREQAEILHRESHGHIKLYVTWNKAVALIKTDISQWQLQRFSNVQRRYTKGPLQLVMCRVTCTQRKIHHKCRSCQRQSRTSCTEPVWLNYLMPVQPAEDVSLGQHVTDSH